MIFESELDLHFGKLKPIALVVMYEYHGMNE